MWGVFDRVVETLVPSGREKKHLVYRDELSKAPLIHREEAKVDERKCSTIGKKEEGTRGVTRVKILMTKAEAERLLSKCKDGGSLEFRDVVREMINIPANRICVVDPETCRRDGLLKTIPEEC